VKNRLSDPFFGPRGDDPEDETREDLCILHYFCKGLYFDIEEKEIDVSRSRLWGVLTELPMILSRNAATPSPSIFKRAASFTIAFMIRSPLDIPFTNGRIPEQYRTIPNHQNALAAFEYCRRGFKDALIFKNGKPEGKSTPQPFTLSNKIQVSKHFYWDVVHAISNIKAEGCFHFISLLYESLAYKSNPGASYPETV
jgi:hypothetical protein